MRDDETDGDKIVLKGESVQLVNCKKNRREAMFIGKLVK